MKKQSGHQFCGGTDHASNPNRRDFLSVGALGGLGLGLTLGDLLSLEAQAAGEDWLCALPLHAQVKAPKTEFSDYLVAPVQVHRLITPGELNLTTTLTAQDLEEIFRQVNRIWGHAGIHFPVATLTTEAAAHPNAYRQNYRSRNLRWMLALRPPNTRTLDHFHVYYLKRFLANGVYIGPGGMFVKDMAKLWKVENGIEKPIPRVTSHELGHALTLNHRQEATNLMASGTSGWTLNEAEIKQSRTAAQKLK